MVIKDLKKEITSLIGARDAQLLITGILNMSVTDYIIKDSAEVSKTQVSELKEYAKRIASGEPLQYVVGMTEFMSLKFHVEDGCLIPRPDTEVLVEKAIDIIGNKCSSVLDIGTGSGCVAISIAHYCKDATVSSLDISQKALSVAENNANANNTRVNFIKCDILNEVPNGSYDIIVSNPPYIPTAVIEGLDSNVKDHEPKLALDGGNDGLDFYRRITEIAPSLLNPGGTLLYEAGHDQAQDVKKLMEKDFENIGIIKDLCGIERVVYATKKQ